MKIEAGESKSDKVVQWFEIVNLMSCLSTVEVQRSPLFSSALLSRYGMTCSTGPNGTYLLTWKPAFLSPYVSPSAIPISCANWSLRSTLPIPNSVAFSAAICPATVPTADDHPGTQK